MKECVPSREKICVKTGLNLLHSGTNDLKSTKPQNEISNDIIKLAIDMKTDGNGMVVSGIIPRDYEFNEKCENVNNFLKTEYTKYALGFLDYSNITQKSILWQRFTPQLSWNCSAYE